MAKEELDLLQENATEEMPATEETAAPKSRKDTYMEGFKKKHPDLADDDEEGFYGALSDDQAAMDEEMNGYRSREEEMSNAMSGSPMNAALFMDAANGTPIPLALLQRFPEEIKSWMDDPTNADALKKTFEEHAAKLEQNKKLQAEADANLEQSNAILDEMVNSGECTEEEINSALELLGNIAAGLMVNHIEKEWIVAALKAMNHDSDVEAAKAQGEIDGRNQKITAQRRDSQRGSANHAGLGAPNAGQRLSSRETAQATGAGKRSMWDGMKTNKLE